MRTALYTWVFVGLSLLTNARAVEFLSPDRLKPGMKGYGLSVFKGQKPERFDIEVLGVLKNTFPKQDMILIRMSGAGLEKHKVIAGMSGSPIYVEGKLIGALAYGWAFENEPLAGVTPIHNMMAELNRPAAAPDTSSALARVATFEPDTRLFPWPRWDTPRVAAGLNAPQPLLTPLSLGGFSPRVIESLTGEFQQLGLWPVAVGGATDPVKPNAAARFEPGSALGVALIRGDLNAVAVGTVTHVEGDRVLGFGHPFFQGGNVRAPAMLAEVHTIMSSMARSFKMATGTMELGAMVGDWQSCIVADTTIRARMIPLVIDVANRGTGQHENYSIEVMDNQAITPQLVLMAILQSISAATSASQDTTVRVQIGAELAPIQPGRAGRTVRMDDTFFSNTGNLIKPESLRGLLQLFNTPYGNVPVKQITVNVDAQFKRNTAEIKRAYFTTPDVRPGETASLVVVLKPFDQPEVKRTLRIEVPRDDDAMQQLTVVLLDGTAAPADVARPDNLHDYLDVIERQHRATDLVAMVPTSSVGMQYRGKLLRKLPASARDVLDDSSALDVTAALDIRQVVEPTDWVLSGRAVVRVPIQED